jgi:hypothetical protein
MFKQLDHIDWHFYKGKKERENLDKERPCATVSLTQVCAENTPPPSPYSFHRLPCMD